MTDVETRLHDALTDLTENVQVRGDAWQEHQRRRAVARSRIGSRLLLVAAAVIVVIALVGGLLGALNGKPDRSTPAHGSGNGSGDSSSSDEVFANGNLLGPIVAVESVQMGGVQAVHEAALSDTSGKGPSLCDRITTAASASGSCTSRVPGADKAGVAFDWLSGTTGSGDIRGVLAGVDKRVMKVQIWMDNGDMTLADLKPGGWEGTKLFALTVPADGPRPQRMVAYSDASGTVLQAVDLPSMFGRSWSGPDSVCAHPGSTGGGRWPIPGSGAPNDVSLGLGGAEALVSTRTSAGAIESTCLDLGPTSLAGWIDVARTFVGVAGPEVALIQIRRGTTVVSQVKASNSQGTQFQVAVLRDLPTDLRGTEVVAVDVTGHVIDRVDYRPRSDR
jgi:hypothetical protein